MRECEGACLPACLPVWSNAPAATRSSDPCDIVHLPDMFTAKLRDPLALIVLLAAAGCCWPAALGHTFMPEENLSL